MNWRKLVAGAAGVAATAAASAVNPALGAVVGSALVGGGATKAVGKQVESYTKRPVHKGAAPVAAVAAAGGAAQFVDPEALCTAINQVCSNPAFIGLGVVGLHQLVTGLLRSATPRN
jgi:streptogramin lyase